MLHKEFEELIGREATKSEYVMANAIYMGCGDAIDKQTFCAEYMKLQGNPLFMYVFKDWKEEHDAKEFEANRAAELELELESQKEVTDKLRNDLVAFLVEQAHELFSMDLRNKAIEMLGEKGKAKYIKMCLEREYELWASTKKR